MIITPDALKALMTGFRKNYQDGLQIAKSQYKDIATVVPSSTKSNTYGWLGQWPGFREWVGDRAFNDMAAHSYAIANKHFESSVKVNRDDIEDDNIGIYAPLFTEMGRAAAAFPDQQVFELLKKGNATLCYDGQNFFDTDHPVFEKVDGTGNKTLVKNLFTAMAFCTMTNGITILPCTCSRCARIWRLTRSWRGRRGCWRAMPCRSTVWAIFPRNKSVPIF